MNPAAQRRARASTRRATKSSARSKNTTRPGAVIATALAASTLPFALPADPAAAAAGEGSVTPFGDAGHHGHPGSGAVGGI
ncbi:MAG TPA: hypothetical protein VGB03_05375, partial [Acidimicrobiales bacterium]